jgi:hypothetical protein
LNGARLCSSDVGQTWQRRISPGTEKAASDDSTADSLVAMQSLLANVSESAVRAIRAF